MVDDKKNGSFEQPQSDETFLRGFLKENLKSDGSGDQWEAQRAWAVFSERMRAREQKTNWKWLWPVAITASFFVFGSIQLLKPNGSSFDLAGRSPQTTLAMIVSEVAVEEYVWDAYGYLDQSSVDEADLSLEESFVEY